VRCRTCAKQQISVSGFGYVRKKMALHTPELNGPYVLPFTSKA